MNLNLEKPIAIIDIETTGLNKQNDRIVDICIIKIFPDGTKETFQEILNPEIPIPQEATKVHGITDSDVVGKPTFKEIAPRVINFIDGCDWCGFNLINFDLGLIESEFNRVGVSYSSEGRKVIDVLKIYYKLEPRDLSSAYLKYCGEILENAHKAEEDAKATIKVLESQLGEHIELPRDVSELHELCSPKDPSWIDKEGKIKWFNNKAVINFGKNRGKTLEDMQKDDPSYFQWIIGADFSIEVKNIVKSAINGEFPKK